ncbi:FBP domain-containing protein [Motilibacter aurantiacus]|uniref:FBP domain-containing protein n=1 Tax=Motilibacter aurantiacus TaxID=2714955 RepID=UPI00140B1FFE|nr:FBP domain-containing protein [Motilibacter aurantiacus]
MNPLDPQTIRSSFVNCSKTAQKAISVPKLDDVPWDDLDFFGWINPKAPQQGFIVTVRDGKPMGLVLRATDSAPFRTGGALCDLCHAARPGSDVGLFVAPRAGLSGRDGNTVGTYICADLACSLCVRGLRKLPSPQPEPLGTPARIEGLQRRLDAFFRRALGEEAVLAER